MSNKRGKAFGKLPPEREVPLKEPVEVVLTFIEAPDSPSFIHIVAWCKTCDDPIDSDFAVSHLNQAITDHVEWHRLEGKKSD